jgi:hypothetical protein
MAPRGSQQWSIFESTGLCFVSITCIKVRESPLLGNIPPTLTPRGSIIATMRVRASRWSPTVKVGHASAAIERCAEHEQIAAGEEPHAVTPREQMNEAIQEARGLGYYIQRGRERIHESSDQLRERTELAAQSMSSFVQGAARARCGRGCTSVAVTGSTHCRRSISHPVANRRRRSSWTRRGRVGAIGSRSANDSAGTSRISTSGGSVRPALRSRQRSGAARG